MRGFEEAPAKIEATNDDILNAINTLNNSVMKLVNVLAPDTENKPDDKPDNKPEVTE